MQWHLPAGNAPDWANQRSRRACRARVPRGKSRPRTPNRYRRSMRPECDRASANAGRVRSAFDPVRVLGTQEYLMPKSQIICIWITSSEQPLAPPQIPERPNIRQRERKPVLVLVAHGQGKAAIFHVQAAAIPVVGELG